MTRKSRRDIERAVDDMADEEGQGKDLAIVFEDPATGEYYEDSDLTKGPVDPDDPRPVMVLQESLVMSREKAEEENREILGPAEDAPGDAAVEVVPDRSNFEGDT